MSHIEMMESRRLLSATLVGKTVEIDGTRRADVIEVRLNKAGSRVVTTVNGTQATFPLSKIREVDIDAGAGDDRINISPSYTRATDIDGDDGNDTIFSGNGPDDIDGGNGVDYINGGPGRDTIEGGSGRDRLFGGADADVFDDEDLLSEIRDFDSRQDSRDKD